MKENEKLTDAEIVKALEGAYKIEPTTMFFITDYNTNKITTIGIGDIVDLINRLQAENERLNIRCDDCDNIRLTRSEHKVCIKQAKTEAYKEFAERLKETMCQENELYEKCVKDMLTFDYQRGYAECNDRFVWCIDNLLKELVGDNK